MLNQAQRNQFEQNGFLVIENVLNSTLIAAIKSEYAALIDEVALQRKLTTPYWAQKNLDQKLTHLIATDPDAYEFLDISLPLKENLSITDGFHAGPAVFSLLTHPPILDIAESIIGPEIYSNPVQHVRIKPPENQLNATGRGNSNMARTGWHQDAAVIVEAADAAPILTVWVAMTDATPEMGCMKAIAGSHQWPSIGMHCPGKNGVGEIFIPDEYVGKHQAVDLNVKAGGVVLLHKKTWHGAGPNNSNQLRWSFDLRYQPPGYNTGRECFPEFLARSKTNPDNVLKDATQWEALWLKARAEIANGQRDAVFNERWNQYRNDPLCA